MNIFTITLYSKPFISVGGFKSRKVRCFSLTTFKRDKQAFPNQKRWGYWNWYYDGYFHYLGLGIFELFWCNRPDLEYIMKNDKNERSNTREKLQAAGKNK